MGSSLYSWARAEKPKAEKTARHAILEDKTERLVMAIHHGEGEEKYGAGDRIRTGDIDLGKVALYQLSYSRSTETSFSPGNNPDVKRYGYLTQSKAVINL